MFDTSVQCLWKVVHCTVQCTVCCVHHVEPSVKFLVSLEGGALRGRGGKKKIGGV